MPSPLDADEPQTQVDPAKVNPFAAQMAAKAASTSSVAPTDTPVGASSNLAVPPPIIPSTSSGSAGTATGAATASMTSGLTREELLRQAAEAPATSFRLPGSMESSTSAVSSEPATSSAPPVSSTTVEFAPAPSTAMPEPQPELIEPFVRPATLASQPETTVPAPVTASTSTPAIDLPFLAAPATKVAPPIIPEAEKRQEEFAPLDIDEPVAPPIRPTFAPVAPPSQPAAMPGMPQRPVMNTLPPVVPPLDVATALPTGTMNTAPSTVSAPSSNSGFSASPLDDVAPPPPGLQQRSAATLDTPIPLGGSLSRQPRRGFSGGMVALVSVVLLLILSGIGYVMANNGTEVPVFYSMVSGLPRGGVNTNAKAQAFVAARTRYSFTAEVSLKQEANSAASPSPSASATASATSSIFTQNSDQDVKLTTLEAKFIEPSEYSNKGTALLSKIEVTPNKLPKTITAGQKVVLAANAGTASQVSPSPTVSASGAPIFTSSPTAQTSPTTSPAASASPTISPTVSPSVSPSSSPSSSSSMNTSGEGKQTAGTALAWVNATDQTKSLVAASVEDIRRTLAAPVLIPVSLESILRASQSQIASEKRTNNGKSFTAYIFIADPAAIEDYFPEGAVISDVQTGVQYEWHTNIPYDAQLRATVKYKENTYSYYIRYLVKDFDKQIDTVNSNELNKITTLGEATASKGLNAYIGGMGMFLRGVPSNLTNSELQRQEESTNMAFPITPSGKGITQKIAKITTTPPVAVQPASTEAKARDAQRIKDLEDMKKALAEYKKLKGAYPLSSGTSLDQAGTLDALLAALVPTYLTKLPIDPTTDTYWYAYQSNGTTYRLTAAVEDFTTTGAIKVGTTFAYIEVTGQ